MYFLLVKLLLIFLFVSSGNTSDDILNQDFDSKTPDEIDALLNAHYEKLIKTQLKLQNQDYLEIINSHANNPPVQSEEDDVFKSIVDTHGNSKPPECRKGNSVDELLNSLGRSLQEKEQNEKVDDDNRFEADILDFLTEEDDQFADIVFDENTDGIDSTDFTEPPEITTSSDTSDLDMEASDVHFAIESPNQNPKSLTKPSDVTKSIFPEVPSQDPDPDPGFDIPDDIATKTFQGITEEHLTDQQPVIDIPTTAWFNVSDIAEVFLEAYDIYIRNMNAFMDTVQKNLAELGSWIKLTSLKVCQDIRRMIENSLSNILSFCDVLLFFFQNIIAKLESQMVLVFLALPHIYKIIETNITHVWNELSEVHNCLRLPLQQTWNTIQLSLASTVSAACDWHNIIINEIQMAKIYNLLYVSIQYPLKVMTELGFTKKDLLLLAACLTIFLSAKQGFTNRLQETKKICGSELRILKNKLKKKDEKYKQLLHEFESLQRKMIRSDRKTFDKLREIEKRMAWMVNQIKLLPPTIPRPENKIPKSSSDGYPSTQPGSCLPFGISTNYPVSAWLQQKYPVVISSDSCSVDKSTTPQGVSC